MTLQPTPSGWCRCGCGNVNSCIRHCRHPPALLAHVVLLCLQAHMSRQKLPISDYVTDTKSVLDNSLRILQVRAVRGRGDEGTRHNA